MHFSFGSLSGVVACDEPRRHLQRVLRALQRRLRLGSQCAPHHFRLLLLLLLLSLLFASSLFHAIHLLHLELYGLRNDFDLLGEPARREPSRKAEDASAFTRLKTALQLLGITEDQQSQMFQAVAAILHLANLKFTTEPLTKAVMITNEAHLSMAATLLGVPPTMLQKFLTTR